MLLTVAQLWLGALVIASALLAVAVIGQWLLQRVVWRRARASAGSAASAGPVAAAVPTAPAQRRGDGMPSDRPALQET